MKKALSIILALIMILSTVAFAAPSVVAPVETTDEAVVDTAAEVIVEKQASVMADEFSTLVVHLTFDTGVTEFNLPLNNYGTVNFPSEFPAVSGTKFECSYPTKEIKDGALVVSANSSWPRFLFRSSSQSFPKGKYTICVTVTNNCADKRDISFSYGNSGFGSRYVEAGKTAEVDMTYIYDGTKIFNVESLAAIPTTVNKEIDVYTSTSDKQTDFVFDDIKMYYTPMMTVTFDAKGIGTQGNTVVEVLKGETIDLSNFTLAGDEQNIFKGWTDADGKDVSGVVQITENTTFNAKYEQNYGTLVYDVNFDNANGKAFGLTVDNYGSVNIPEGFPAASTVKITSSWTNSVIENGKAAVSSSTGYPRISIVAGSLPHGRYTLFVDFTNKNDVTRALSLSHDNLGLWYSVNIPAGETKTVPMNFTFDGEEIYVFESKKGFPLERLYNLSMYWDANNKGYNEFEYDNIKLYYKPLVTVNFVNDRTDETFDKLRLGYGTSINLDSYVPKNTSEAVFTGWVDEDGNYVSGNISIEENKTFTAQWQELYNDDYGTLIYGLHFNTNAFGAGDNVDSYGLVNLPAGFPAANKTFLTTGFTGTTVGGGKVTAVMSDSGNHFPGLAIESTAGFPQGKYTLLYDVVNTETATEGTKHGYTGRLRGSGDLGVFESPSVGLGEKVTAGGTFTFVDGKVNFYAWGHDNPSNYATVTSIALMVSTKEASKFEIDNMYLYYRAPVKVNFSDPSGYAVSVPASVTAFDGETYAGLNDVVCTSNNASVAFKGWAYEQNGTVIGNETKVLDSDITLVAVWEEKSLVTSYNTNSIRTSDPDGIRFMASVKQDVKSDEKTTEYGFIVTLGKHLGDKSADYLTFEQNDVMYVYGANYDTANNLDKVYNTENDDVFFTSVIYGISPSKTNYEQVLVVRPYIKYNSVTYYGTPMMRSVLDVAKTYRDKDYDGLSVSETQYIKNILEICGESTEATVA